MSTKLARQPSNRKTETIRDEGADACKCKSSILLICLASLFWQARLGQASQLADFNGATFYKAPEGSRVRLTCNGSQWARAPESVSLVLWFKGPAWAGQHQAPIYTLDARARPVNAGARHLVADAYRGRAKFVTRAWPPYLDLSPIEANDQAEFRCRIDYRASPRESFLAILFVIVPPKSLAIVELQSGRELGASLGPLSEFDDQRQLMCLSRGGRPEPAIKWRRNGRELDDSYLTLGDFVALKQLKKFAPNSNTSTSNSDLDLEVRNSNFNMFNSDSDSNSNSNGHESSKQFDKPPPLSGQDKTSKANESPWWPQHPEQRPSPESVLAEWRSWPEFGHLERQLRHFRWPQWRPAAAASGLPLRNNGFNGSSMVMVASDDSAAAPSSPSQPFGGPAWESSEQLLTLGHDEQLVTAVNVLQLGRLSGHAHAGPAVGRPEFECRASNLHYDLRTLIRLYAPSSLFGQLEPGDSIGNPPGSSEHFGQPDHANAINNQLSVQDQLESSNSKPNSNSNSNSNTANEFFMQNSQQLNQVYRFLRASARSQRLAALHRFSGSSATPPPAATPAQHEIVDHEPSAATAADQEGVSPLEQTARCHQLAAELDRKLAASSQTQPNATELSPFVVTKTVALDIYLRPTQVRILGPERALSANQLAEFVCQTSGSRPGASISWLKSGQPLDSNLYGASNATSGTLGGRPDPQGVVMSATGNSSSSSASSRLLVKLGAHDNGAQLACRVRNEQLASLTSSSPMNGGHEDEDSSFSLEDSRLLSVQYPPKLQLELGNRMLSSTIREHSDLYFVCQVDALPAVKEIGWLHNERPIGHPNEAPSSAPNSAGLGERGQLIMSNNSLVLQRVRMSQSGSYACLASNAEGAAQSNRIQLRVLHAPVCLDVKHYRDAALLIEPKAMELLTSLKSHLFEHSQGYSVCLVVADPPQVDFGWLTNDTNAKLLHQLRLPLEHLADKIGKDGSPSWLAKHLPQLKRPEAWILGPNLAVSVMPTQLALDEGELQSSGLLCKVKNSIGEASCPTVSTKSLQLGKQHTARQPFILNSASDQTPSADANIKLNTKFPDVGHECYATNSSVELGAILVVCKPQALFVAPKRLTLRLTLLRQQQQQQQQQNTATDNTNSNTNTDNDAAAEFDTETDTGTDTTRIDTEADTTSEAADIGKPMTRQGYSNANGIATMDLDLDTEAVKIEPQQALGDDATMDSPTSGDMDATRVAEPPRRLGWGAFLIYNLKANSRYSLVRPPNSRLAQFDTIALPAGTGGTAGDSTSGSASRRPLIRATSQADQQDLSSLLASVASLARASFRHRNLAPEDTSSPDDASSGSSGDTATGFGPTLLGRLWSLVSPTSSPNNINNHHQLQQPLGEPTRRQAAANQVASWAHKAPKTPADAKGLWLALISLMLLSVASFVFLYKVCASQAQLEASKQRRASQAAVAAVAVAVTSSVASSNSSSSSSGSSASSAGASLAAHHPSGDPKRLVQSGDALESQAAGSGAMARSKSTLEFAASVNGSRLSPRAASISGPSNEPIGLALPLALPKLESNDCNPQQSTIERVISNANHWHDHKSNALLPVASSIRGNQRSSKAVSSDMTKRTQNRGQPQQQQAWSSSLQHHRPNSKVGRHNNNGSNRKRFASKLDQSGAELELTNMNLPATSGYLNHSHNHNYNVNLAHESYHDQAGLELGHNHNPYHGRMFVLESQPVAASSSLQKHADKHKWPAKNHESSMLAAQATWMPGSMAQLTCYHNLEHQNSLNVHHCDQNNTNMMSSSLANNNHDVDDMKSLYEGSCAPLEQLHLLELLPAGSAAPPGVHDFRNYLSDVVSVADQGYLGEPQHLLVPLFGHDMAHSSMGHQYHHQQHQILDAPSPRPPAASIESSTTLSASSQSARYMTSPNSTNDGSHQ